MIDRVASDELRVTNAQRAGGAATRAQTFNSRYSTFNVHITPHRLSFTLIELLVAISILAILGSAIVFASFEATEAARRAATRTKINVINMLLMDRWESYKSQRPPVDLSRYIQPGMSASVVGRISALHRVRAIRELMKIEIPDRWSDVALSDISDPPSSTRKGNPSVIERRTALSEAYWRRFRQIADAKNSLTGQDNTLGQLYSHQGAECLYMVIMLGTADGEARSFFKESDIGDVDGDGAPEILDGWGQPIQFLRWAPGFAAESELMSGDPAADHDPFDVFRQLPNSFRLVPLIWSAGPDEISDIRATNNYNQATDPYQPTPDGLLGEPRDSLTNGNGEENWQDNIHNHIRDVK